MRTDTRSRLSRGSSEVQVSQSQAIEGTPVEVPVPRKVNRMQDQLFDICDLRFFICHCYWACQMIYPDLSMRVVSNQQIKNLKSQISNNSSAWRIEEPTYRP